MDVSSEFKANEIRSLAESFRSMADLTELPDYRSKLLETASRLFDAADALDGCATHQLERT